MSTPQQIEQVTESVRGALRRCIHEYDLTMAEAIGIMEAIKLELFLEAWHDGQFEEDDDE